MLCEVSPCCVVALRNVFALDRQGQQGSGVRSFVGLCRNNSHHIFPTTLTTWLSTFSIQHLGMLPKKHCGLMKSRCCRWFWMKLIFDMQQKLSVWLCLKTWKSIHAVLFEHFEHFSAFFARLGEQKQHGSHSADGLWRSCDPPERQSPCDEQLSIVPRSEAEHFCWWVRSDRGPQQIACCW